MGNDTRTRKWLVTINNPSDCGLDHQRIRLIMGDMSLEYACMCDEIGKEGTYHTHVFIQGKNQIRFSTMKSKFPSAHFDMANGTAQQNRDYIRKEGKWEKDRKKETNLPETFEEFGECPIERPGRRSDLEDLYDKIKSGMSNFEIMEDDPSYMLHLDKIERVRQTMLEEKYRNEWRVLNVEYHWGETGTGKTRGVMETYGYSNVYRVTDYDHPWDSYRQQDVVVFEEFRSSLKIQDVINYIDGYPLELPCRYVNKRACYTKVFFLTNIPLEDQYPHIQKDQPLTWEAFKRRINNVEQLFHPFSVIKGGKEYELP
jgi:hypothetical protein